MPFAIDTRYEYNLIVSQYALVSDTGEVTILADNHGEESILLIHRATTVCALERDHIEVSLQHSVGIDFQKNGSEWFNRTIWCFVWNPQHNQYQCLGSAVIVTNPKYEGSERIGLQFHTDLSHEAWLLVNNGEQYCVRMNEHRETLSEVLGFVERIIHSPNNYSTVYIVIIGLNGARLSLTIDQERGCLFFGTGGEMSLAGLSDQERVMHTGMGTILQPRIGTTDVAQKYLLPFRQVAEAFVQIVRSDLRPSESLFFVSE